MHVDGVALPPGPRGPALLTMIRSGLRPDAYVEACARRYGDTYTFRLPAHPPIVNFGHPDAIRDILTGDPETLRAGESNFELQPILGDHSLLLLDGARHLRERRLMLPPFHGERMQAYGRLMRDLTDRVIDEWPVGRPFPIHTAMQRLTLDVILRAVFGLDEGATLDRLRTALLRLVRFATGPVGLLLFIPGLNANLGPLSPAGHFVRLKEAVDRLLYAEIAARRADGDPARNDILSLLLEARYEDGSAMPDEALRDEMMTLLLAGHETTATSLAWTFHYLLGREDVLAELAAERRQVAGDGPIEPEHLGRLEYLDAVIKETQRLCPVVPFIGRLLKAPARIGGYDLPAGVIASPAIWLVHRRPDVWPDPLRFTPTRFLGLRPSPYAFLPFGGGVRRCIGAAFATYEMKVVLSRILARTELRAAPGARVRLVRRAVMFAPSNGVPVVLDRRAA